MFFWHGDWLLGLPISRRQIELPFPRLKGREERFWPRPWEASFFFANTRRKYSYVNLVDFSRISMLDVLEGRTLVSITVPYGISFNSLTCLPCNLIPSLCRWKMCHSMRNSSSLGEFQVTSSSPLSSLHLTRIHTWLIPDTVIRTIYVGLCM